MDRDLVMAAAANFPTIATWAAAAASDGGAMMRARRRRPEWRRGPPCCRHGGAAVITRITCLSGPRMRRRRRVEGRRAAPSMRAASLGLSRTSSTVLGKLALVLVFFYPVLWIRIRSRIDIKMLDQDPDFNKCRSTTLSFALFIFFRSNIAGFNSSNR